jgi:uncharacterized protein (TIGR00255 family)
MTGFGNASYQTESVVVSAEIKSVNNRYLKLSLRMPESLSRFESDVERLVRTRITRGAVQLTLRVRFPGGQSEYRIDNDLLQGLQQQLAGLTLDRNIVNGGVALGELLQLPGVVSQTDLPDELLSSVWPVVETALGESLEHLSEFRCREGEHMRLDLERQCHEIEARLREVVAMAPQVVIEYRDKILERVRRLIGDAAIRCEESDVIREVAQFADRCDINEEITRLRSHCEQFLRMLNSDSSQGRKLEFISQEMFREINTIGSKANHVSIALSVVEMKTAIERIREILQNVE